jgi:hypothetical protein
MPLSQPIRGERQFPRSARINIKPAVLCRLFRCCGCGRAPGRQVRRAVGRRGPAALRGGSASGSDGDWALRDELKNPRLISQAVRAATTAAMPAPAPWHYPPAYQVHWPFAWWVKKAQTLGGDMKREDPRDPGRGVRADRGRRSWASSRATWFRVPARGDGRRHREDAGEAWTRRPGLKWSERAGWRN